MLFNKGLLYGKKYSEGKTEVGSDKGVNIAAKWILFS